VERLDVPSEALGDEYPIPLINKQNASDMSLA
jgi:hypothetical protein